MKIVVVNRFFHPDLAPTGPHAADVAFDLADIAPRREAFLFGNARPPVTDEYGEFIPDASVYSNAQARHAVYRRPWVACR